MRKKASYQKKYGNLKLYSALQSQAAQARWKAFYRDRRNPLLALLAAVRP